jgi:translin
MQPIDEIAERIRKSFDARTAARDRALAQTRLLTRHCANAIRAVHREEYELADEHLSQARELVRSLQSDLAQYADLYHSGYTQERKGFAEGSVYALVQDFRCPAPGA